jgi:hypothetical protein
MAVIDDLRHAVSSAVAAGSTAARVQGTALKGDFESLVKPQLDDILVEIEAITAQFVVGDIAQDQAQDDLTEQCNRVTPVILRTRRTRGSGHHQCGDGRAENRGQQGGGYCPALMPDQPAGAASV